ncbi:macro domain-containing protein [Variovorax sp. OV700]|uniref:macro domain-containing protein n=1 Tax=Variovorax sp. OV700 TaxID=1882826 RepID=UPI00088BC354|nr:macro domain-containing protein [Variovorax sp. OV700]SDI65800.1 hypothetical protein SAMN05444748_106227 [Variovorax sp. OV700]
MRPIQSLIDLIVGIRRQPLLLLVYGFTAFSVLSTLGQGIDFFVPGIELKGKFALWIVIAISVIYALKRVWKPSRIEISVANSNAVIEILFDDLFAQDGIRVIAVNEFFDSKLGRPVSDKSLHGIFIRSSFGGHPDSFDKQVDDELKMVQYVDVPEKVEGKTKAYPIGASALVAVNQDRYLCFAFAKTNPQDCKAFSDVTLMWQALNDLWKRARSEANGHPVNVPLVGSGLSGLGLPTRDLLNLIILSAITETKAKPITNKIRIVLHRDRFDQIDLRDVKKHWKE